MTDAGPVASNRAPWSGQQGWHLANWGPLGWLETVVKTVAIVIAIVAAFDDGGATVPDGHELPYWILVGVAIGYSFAVADRIIDREAFAMVFVVAMVAGHWAIVWAAGGSEWPAGAISAFAALMLAGDLVKIGYFLTTGARVRDIPRPVPIVMTATLAIAYLVVLLTA